ncbi:hypothetical protein GMLC_34170 [Geomonas limicola]|uniref:histidine kinase n=2 Tax=Geomonas limicola TaxID=2740186 RepID=A0A6V8NB42_9BACT|nr:hypothetical protein GMLC_34170 [Geomonas limicola]
MCSPAAAALFDSTAHGLVGRTLTELLAPASAAQAPSLQHFMDQALRSGSCCAEVRLASPAAGGTLRATITPLAGGSPLPQYFHWLIETTASQHAESDRRVQALLEAMPHPVYLKDASGNFCDCNEHFTGCLHLPRTEILGKLPSQLDSREVDIVKALEAACPSRDPRLPGTLQSVRHTTGGTSTLFFIEVPLLDDNGAEYGLVGIIADLTEQTLVKEEQQLQATMLEDEIAKHQQVAEALRQREKMLSLVINAVPQNIFWKDTNLVYAGCNDAFARAAGLSSPSEVVGKTDFDLPWSREEAEGYRRDDREVMRLDRAKYHLTETQLQADGSQVIVDTTKIPLHGDSGCVVGVLGVYEDISQRTEVERRLKESEERLSVIFEASQVGIVLVSPDGRISFANRRMAEMFGVSLAELLGTSYLTWLHPSEEDEGSTLTARIISGELASVAVERHYRRRDGSDFWGYLSGRRLENSDGSLRALVGCIADVTELKASQSALQREKERLAVTLRSIGDGVITVDTAGKVVLLNRVAEELCGYHQEEVAGLPLDQVFRVIEERSRTPKANAIARVLGTGEVVEQSGNGVLVARDGTERIIVSKTAPILDRNQAIPGAVLVFSDITERRGIEEELFKARKLESLGILAGGIAHDFNNLLTGIMGNIALSRATLPDEHQAAAFLDRARKGAEQSKALTQQLLTFSKGGAPVKKLTSISQVLTDSATFALRGSNVRCDFDIAPDLWSAEIDTGQMSQVISNLVINADQAMPEGGTILIRAENVLPMDEEDRQHRIRITFKDTGTGISKEDLSRIYDPYFSTKATGNGLGLATVYAIIKNHDGEIKVFSRRGHGTTFAITLPAQDEAVPEVPVQQPSAETLAANGGGRILLMDDEDAIREMAKAALAMFGYQPVVVSDGEELLEVYQKDLAGGQRFDAVIMDLTIPGGMGGKDAVKRLLEIDPDAVAIASSGYSEDLVMARYREFGFSGVVSKPYSLHDLEVTLKEIIARNKG